MTDDTENLKILEQRLLWLSSWILHNANHLRQKEDGDVKVGGHQASCASMVSIMSALYFHTPAHFESRTTIPARSSGPGHLQCSAK